MCLALLLKGEGATQLGIPEDFVQGWIQSAHIPLNELPKSIYRRPYSSVYQTLQNLILTCKESLRL